MTSTPSVRSGPHEKQAPIAPDRMTLVEDWRHGAAMVEVYADPKAGDGCVILFERYAPEQAATINDATDSPSIAWLNGYADRSEDWKRDLSAEIRARLTSWARS